MNYRIFDDRNGDWNAPAPWVRDGAPAWLSQLRADEPQADDDERTGGPYADLEDRDYRDGDRWDGDYRDGDEGRWEFADGAIADPEQPRRYVGRSRVPSPPIPDDDRTAVDELAEWRERRHRRRRAALREWAGSDDPPVPGQGRTRSDDPAGPRQSAPTRWDDPPRGPESGPAGWGDLPRRPAPASWDDRPRSGRRDAGLLGWDHRSVPGRDAGPPDPWFEPDPDGPPVEDPPPRRLAAQQWDADDSGGEPDSWLDREPPRQRPPEPRWGSGGVPGRRRPQRTPDSPGEARDLRRLGADRRDPGAGRAVSTPEPREVRPDRPPVAARQPAEARERDPAKPRVVAREAAPPQPRVLSRQAAPAKPRVVSKAAPPPLRVVSTGRPAAAGLTPAPVGTPGRPPNKALGGPQPPRPIPAPRTTEPWDAEAALRADTGIRTPATPARPDTPIPTTPARPPAPRPVDEREARPAERPATQPITQRTTAAPTEDESPAPATDDTTTAGDIRIIDDSPTAGDIQTAGADDASDPATGGEPTAPPVTAEPSTPIGDDVGVAAVPDRQATDDPANRGVGQPPAADEQEPAADGTATAEPVDETVGAASAEPVRDPINDLITDLAALRWRLDLSTLREVVDDQDELAVLGGRLEGALAEAADNRSRARLLSLRTEVLRLLGDLDRATSVGRLAVAHATATGDSSAVALAQAELAHVLRLRGDFPAADRLFAEAVAADVPDLMRAAVYENAGRCCVDQKRYLEACNYFGWAVRLGDAEDRDFVARIEVAIDTVYIGILRDGWGPLPRARAEILGHPA